MYLQAGSGRLAYQHLEDGDDVQPARKKRKVASSSRVLRPRGVAEQFRQTDVSDVQEVLYCTCTYMYVHVCSVSPKTIFKLGGMGVVWAWSTFRSKDL